MILVFLFWLEEQLSFKKHQDFYQHFEWCNSEMQGIFEQIKENKNISPFSPLMLIVS